MTAPEPISKELQAKIDALADEDLRNDIISIINGPGVKSATNEQIFNNKVASYERVMKQRALLHAWSDEEVLSFVDFFARELPEFCRDFQRQEREGNEIADDTWWKAGRLAERFFPDLSSVDYSSLLGLVRRHFRSRHLD